MIKTVRQGGREVYILGIVGIVATLAALWAFRDWEEALAAFLLALVVDVFEVWKEKKKTVQDGLSKKRGPV